MTTGLRSTRRGWMVFSAAPIDGSGGGSQAPADQAAADAAKVVAGQPLDYKTLLATLLDLDPATADDAAIKAAFDAEEAKPEVDIAALQTQASSAADLQAQLDQKTAEINKAYSDMDSLRKQQAEAEADDILTAYKDRFVDDAAMAPIRAILISDKQAGIAILNGLKKPEAAAPSGDTTTAGEPPAPKHDPGADTQPTAEEKAAQAETLIATIRKEGKFKDYTAAREEARRQKPELFS